MTANNPHESENKVPYIYVACLASYNCGILYGCWINALQDPDKILHDIRKMLAHSPLLCGDEWAIHDYENFHSLKLDEYEDIASVCQKAKFVAEYGELGTKIMSHLGCDIDDATRYLEENYYGEFESATSFAEYYFDEIYGHNLPITKPDGLLIWTVSVSGYWAQIFLLSGAIGKHIYFIIFKLYHGRLLAALF